VPKRTDTEWQKLSDRIAWEVVGLRRAVELPEDVMCVRLIPYRGAEGSTVGRSRFGTRLTKGSWFEFKEELANVPAPGMIIAIPWVEAYDRGRWRPDENIAQAMLALRTLLTNIGRYAIAELEIRISPSRCRVTIQNWVATGGVPAMFVRSPYADNEMHAICLAAERWLDVQGLPDEASDR